MILQEGHERSLFIDDMAQGQSLGKCRAEKSVMRFLRGEPTRMKPGRSVLRTSDIIERS